MLGISRLRLIGFSDFTGWIMIASVSGWETEEISISLASDVSNISVCTATETVCLVVARNCHSALILSQNKLQWGEVFVQFVDLHCTWNVTANRLW